MRKQGKLGAGRGTWGGGGGAEEARAARLRRPPGATSQDYADSQGSGGHSGIAGQGGNWKVSQGSLTFKMVHSDSYEEW